MPAGLRCCATARSDTVSHNRGGAGSTSSTPSLTSCHLRRAPSTSAPASHTRKHCAASPAALPLTAAHSGALSAAIEERTDAPAGGTGLATGTSGGSATAPPLPTAVDHSLDSFKALVADKKFKCTMCGKCCTGAGEVWVSDAEVERLASHFAMSVPKFRAANCKQYDRRPGWSMLRYLGASKDCVFLDVATNKCKVHDVRPAQCSTYPWWPELQTREGWEYERDNVCEGFDHPDAEALDVEEAARQLRIATTQEALQHLAWLKPAPTPSPPNGWPSW